MLSHELGRSLSGTSESSLQAWSPVRQRKLRVEAAQFVAMSRSYNLKFLPALCTMLKGGQREHQMISVAAAQRSLQRVWLVCFRHLLAVCDSEMPHSGIQGIQAVMDSAVAVCPTVMRTWQLLLTLHLICVCGRQHVVTSNAWIAVLHVDFEVLRVSAPGKSASCQHHGGGISSCACRQCLLNG